MLDQSNDLSLHVPLCYSFVRKRTASGRAQRASARNQNGQTVAVPLESTSSGEAPAQLHPIPSPMETDSLPGVPEDEPSLSRSNSSSNFRSPLPMGDQGAKTKGRPKRWIQSLLESRRSLKAWYCPLLILRLCLTWCAPLILLGFLAHVVLKLNNDDHCSSCRSHGDLVYCDGCPRAFHLWCVDPPLETIEEGDSRWFCPACMIRKVGSSSSLSSCSLASSFLSNLLLNPHHLFCRP